MKKNILLIAMVAISFTINGQNETVNGNLQVNGRINGGFGAYTTNGVLDWNDITNTISGSGYSLLLASTALNSPGGSNVYYHPFNFEYSSKNGSGNITQLAIPYGISSGINNGIWMRGRYSNNWTSWVKILSENLQGNVGIGTTNPIYVLDIKSSNDDYKQLRITSPGSPLIKLSGVYNSGNGAEFWQNASGDVRLNVNSTTNGLFIKSNGNLGVGTSAPNSKLSIREGGLEMNFLMNKKLEGAWPATTENYTLTMQASGSAAGNIAFASGNSEMMRINTSGNLGIGTTNPLYKLHIHESGTTGSVPPTRIHLTNSETGAAWNDGLQIIQNGVNQNYKANFLLRENAQMAFWTNNIERFTIDKTGNIGIGTTNPGTWKLAVNGPIRAKEIKVETGWSDFVFEKSYDLPTLEEVENHIKEKGHLKDIPSAQEVAENGIFLGQMDSKLLQKIEELTLYTIQQEKKIYSLKKEVNNLKKEDKTLQLLLKKVEELQKEMMELKAKN